MEVGGITIIYNGEMRNLVVTPEIFKVGGKTVLCPKDYTPGTTLYVDENLNVFRVSVEE